MPKPMSLGMTHKEDEEPRCRSPYSVIGQLESAVGLSSTLQAQHATAQSTVSALESKVTALEELVHAQFPSVIPSRTPT